MTPTDEHEAMLAALAHRPADVDAWLIYADWLEDHGEPFAAHIRAHRTDPAYQWIVWPVGMDLTVVDHGEPRRCYWRIVGGRLAAMSIHTPPESAEERRERYLRLQRETEGFLCD